jgi:hypothetical protein
LVEEDIGSGKDHNMASLPTDSPVDVYFPKDGHTEHEIQSNVVSDGICSKMEFNDYELLLLQQIYLNPTPQPEKAVVDANLVSYFDYSFFIDINFLLSMEIPKFISSGPLAMSKLRPKEVSLIRISGRPYLRNWYINYGQHEGRSDVMKNRFISRIAHGMTWETMDEKACTFDQFLNQLKSYTSSAKLYTRNSLVSHYLTNVCNFENVVKLDERKIVEFDPYICECVHHSWTSQSLRRCTNNQVWALRHTFSTSIL